ncbi:hypothetical protein V5O48_004434 [Marasmius crinis-equi]|uniref:O-methyltransferase C-terminal domain-containing protein n=1 Tax=Marasmius crinis-equi TaxID=585013 RepID=A0ABR3FQ28_9AGAR
MTFTVLRQLHSIIGEALDEIERVYAEAGSSTDMSGPPTPASLQWSSSSPPSPCSPSSDSAKPAFGNGYASPPPSPPTSSFPSALISPDPIDFPSLDRPYEPNSPSEALMAHPEVSYAINKIVAACGQMSATVEPPFLSICDAAMAYHLPSCLRLFEATHTAEILEQAGPNGLHVKTIAEHNGIDATKLVSPNVFANNRLSSMIVSGKSIEDIKECPEKKYDGSSGVAAFTGLCTDELQKSSAYLTEAYFLSPKAHLNTKEPTRAPFNYAFGCEGVDFFAWLEGHGIQGQHVNGRARSGSIKLAGILSQTSHELKRSDLSHRHGLSHKKGSSDVVKSQLTNGQPDNPNRFRLERFGIAMTGTDSWEVPGAIFNGFEWRSLPKGSLIVDVGGGIGSTMMLLAHAFSRPGVEDAMGFKYIIQDRQVVVDMGEKAWRSKCPEYLDLDIAEFQVHDFFTPQPIRNVAVFFLRVVLHDWPTEYARTILLHLREAATPDTKLLIADFVVPLACPDDFGLRPNENGDGIEGIEGAENQLPPAPLLPNLGKASAHVYWMDLTMQVTFNGQERTLREIVALTRSAGWKVTRVVKAPGSHFGHITAIPTDIPSYTRPAKSSSFAPAPMKDSPSAPRIHSHVLERSMSRCGTPTFGSKVLLPSFEEVKVKPRFGFGFGKGSERRSPREGTLKPAPHIGPTPRKRPSPLAIPNSPSTPTRTIVSSSALPQSPIKRRPSHAHISQLYLSSLHQESTSPTPGSRNPPPLSPRLPVSPLSRRSSFANLSAAAATQAGNGAPPMPSLIPVRQLSESSITVASTIPTPPSPAVSRHKLPRRQSLAQLTPTRKRSESIVALPSRGGLEVKPPMPSPQGCDTPRKEAGTYARRALDFSATSRGDETSHTQDSQIIGCSLLESAVQI